MGLICMATQVHLPRILTETARYIGSCNSALTMFIVGTILADVKLVTILEADPEHPINSMVFQVTNYTALPDSQYGIVCFRQKPNATFLKSPTDNSQDRIAFSGDPAL